MPLADSLVISPSPLKLKVCLKIEGAQLPFGTRELHSWQLPSAVAKVPYKKEGRAKIAIPNVEEWDYT